MCRACQCLVYYSFLALHSYDPIPSSTTCKPQITCPGFIPKVSGVFLRVLFLSVPHRSLRTLTPPLIVRAAYGRDFVTDSCDFLFSPQWRIIFFAPDAIFTNPTKPRFSLFKSLSSFSFFFGFQIRASSELATKSHFRPSFLVNPRRSDRFAIGTPQQRRSRFRRNHGRGSA